MNTISDIANKSNRKLYMNHLSSLAKLREARLRIELLEGILKRAVDGYNQAYCRDEVNFDWVEDAEVALRKKTNDLQPNALGEKTDD